MDPDQLASKKPADLDLHCLSGFGMTEAKVLTDHRPTA